MWDPKRRCLEDEDFIRSVCFCLLTDNEYYQAMDVAGCYLYLQFLRELDGL